MYGTCRALATPATHSAIFSACFSLSMTHGPAIRKRSGPPLSMLPTLKGFTTKDTTEHKDYHSILREPSCPLWLSLVYFFRTVEAFQIGGLFARAELAAMLVRCADKSAEQRMRFQRLRLELRMELAAQEVGMSGKLHNFDVSGIRSRPGDTQAGAG